MRKCINYFYEFMRFYAEIVERRNLIYELTRRDFKTKYLGSYLGILWAFVHPTIYIVILWFIFQIGFKSKPVDNFPFILWMLTGIIPWFFFSECLGNATNAVVENSFLVKKVVFSIGLLPIVKILSSLIIHLFFIIVIFLMFLSYGYPPNFYNLQVVYYLFSSLILLLGLSLLSSSLTVFLRDVSQIVNMLLQFLFWMTPIFWSVGILPAKLQTLIKLNPVYYLIEGYRSAFIYKIWFWENHHLWTLYFWTVTLIILVAGAVVFRRLRPHFADVL